MRITRQNECGIALDPLTPNSRIQFVVFSDLTFKPDVENGADITMRNACGQIIIRDKDCQRLKGFNTTMKLLGVPLVVLEMLLDTTLLHADTPGDFKGGVLRESKFAPCAPSKQLEVWSKNANAQQAVQNNACVGVFVQYLLPHTKNWEIQGDLAFVYATPLEYVLEGYAENNPGWYPSWPAAAFNSYVPGGGDPAGTPTGAPGPVLPNGIVADTWTTSDQAAIRAGGPLAWQEVGALPSPLADCDYVGVTDAS
jgi:hypothetical protein